MTITLLSDRGYRGALKIKPEFGASLLQVFTALDVQGIETEKQNKKERKLL